MASTTTLGTLRGMARRYADFRVANQFLDDTTAVNPIINDCIADYYDVLVAVRGHEYFLTDTTVSVVAGTASYSLPDSLYQLSTIVLEWSTRENELLRPIVSNRDIPRYQNAETWDRCSVKGYRLSGAQEGTQTLTFYPTPASSVTCRVRYVPAFEPLEEDEDVIAIFSGFDTLIALDAAMRMRSIADLPTGNLATLFQRKLDAVMAMATERMQDEPHQVVDVDPIDNSEGFEFRRYARGFSST
jgi:hypothetical protein